MKLKEGFDMMGILKRGFTLIEVLITIAISSILLLIVTDRFIIGAFQANNNYNQTIDLQTGVKTSIENVKGILKKTSQVHLVGKEVYEPKMDLNKLDNSFNYIAFREDENGNKFLANIVYNLNHNRFDVIPLTASGKNDIMNNNNIKYNLNFYEKDVNYKDKMSKNILNINVKGISSNIVDGKEENLKEFELMEDIALPNVNQILISKYLKGGLANITAIAYDDDLIKKETVGGKAAIVFILDGSSSMRSTMYGSRPKETSNGSGKYKLDAAIDETGKKYEATVVSKADIFNTDKPYRTRKIIAGDSINNTFLKSINRIANERNIDIQIYIYDYWYKTRIFDVYNPEDYTKTYLYPLDELEKKGYGPYKMSDSGVLKKLQTHVKEKKGFIMDFYEEEHYSENAEGHGGTNTGYALVQGFEILQQLKNEKRMENRFLILMTDGVPTNFTAAARKIGKKDNTVLYDDVKYVASREEYNSYMPTRDRLVIFNNNEYTKATGKNDLNAVDYVKYITNPLNGYNEKDLYKKAYLIGFSSLKWEKDLLGFADGEGKIPSKSIKACLMQSGNAVDTFDAYNATELEKSLKQIVEDIQINLNVFDGPQIMKK